MPRIDLRVPYEEKDEAKKLGAKWDAAKKIWYAPDGVNAAAFEKWIPVKREPPEMIIFKRNSEGRLSARIDNLEICCSPDSWHIITWDKIMDATCRHDKCPEGDGYYFEQNCPHDDNCPYLVPAEEAIGTLYPGLRETFTNGAEEEAAYVTYIRNILTHKTDGIGHHVDWPEPAASEFAAATWKVEWD